MSQSRTSDRLRVMLHNVFTVPRSHAASDAFRKGAGDYISKKFGLLGLLTGLQMFKPTQFHRKVSFLQGHSVTRSVGSSDA